MNIIPSVFLLFLIIVRKTIPVYRFLPFLVIALNVSVSMATTSKTLDVPQIVWSDIRQGTLIGSGGYGDVYRGQWKGQDVAIKELKIKTLTTSQIQREFGEEVNMMWRCQFPRILKLYGVCVETNHCSMVFELMQESLHDLIHSGKDISEESRLQMAVDIAEGLVNLHDQKILHSDLKSHNILLDKRGRAKISDFGLAKLRTHTSTVTGHHAVGTIRWCAPELLGLRPKLSSAADVYSYGMILWELITRKTPFEDQPRDQIIISAVLGGEREEIPDHCPLVWKEIIETCWEKVPGSRPTATGILERFMALRISERAVWLPGEDPLPSTIGGGGYTVYSAGEEDWKRVLGYYKRRRVAGYDVGRIDVIFNPAMNQSFEAKRRILQQRQGNPRYVATWKEESQGDLRAAIAKHLEDFAVALPLYDDCPDVRVFPLWHGTQKGNLGSLFSSGYGAFGDTDHGYFGKGIYASHEAAYAELYANRMQPEHRDDGVLILNWGITYSSYPIINLDYDPVGKRLFREIDTAKYDTRFIPVVPGSTPGDYVPITPPGRHDYTEMVFLDPAQILPRYIITLQPSKPSVVDSQAIAMDEALKKEREAQKRAALEEKRLRDEKEAKRKADEEVRRRSEEDRVRREAESQKISKQVPEIARGYEDIYQRFLKGVLVYRPTQGSDVGKIELPIGALSNPLEGMFDLSRCGDTGKYLSIATGYRKGKNPQNKDKVEIWIAPRFMIEKELATTADHFKDIMDKWNKDRAPVGLFWTYGGWAADDHDMAYLTDNSFDQVGDSDLWEKYKKADTWWAVAGAPHAMVRFLSCFVFELSKA